MRGTGRYCWKRKGRRHSELEMTMSRNNATVANGAKNSTVSKREEFGC